MDLLTKHSDELNAAKDMITEEKSEPFQAKQLPEDDKSRLSVTVAVQPDTAFDFFRDFRNLPLFMKDLKAIEIISETASHWTVEVKGFKAEWDAEIIKEVPGEMISWQSVDGSEVETSGSIWFSPGPDTLGTVISLDLDYKLPGGKLTEFITELIGEDPKSLAFINLKRLKCYLETGEVATIEGQPNGQHKDAESLLKH